MFLMLPDKHKRIAKVTTVTLYIYIYIYIYAHVGRESVAGWSSGSIAKTQRIMLLSCPSFFRALRPDNLPPDRGQAAGGKTLNGQHGGWSSSPSRSASALCFFARRFFASRRVHFAEDRSGLDAVIGLRWLSSVGTAVGIPALIVLKVGSSGSGGSWLTFGGK